MKKNTTIKGITLISLVITIIILLILAGISISSFTGSGLFEKAKEARNQTIQKSNEEIIKLAIQELQIYKNGNAKIQDLNLFDEENSECYKKDIKLKNKVNEQDETAVLIIGKYEYKIDTDLQIIYEENNKKQIEVNYICTKLPITENDNNAVITL